MVTEESGLGQITDGYRADEEHPLATRSYDTDDDDDDVLVASGGCDMSFFQVRPRKRKKIRRQRRKRSRQREGRLAPAVTPLSSFPLDSSFVNHHHQHALLAGIITSNQSASTGRRSTSSMDTSAPPSGSVSLHTLSRLLHEYWNAAPKPNPKRRRVSLEEGDAHAPTATSSSSISSPCTISAPSSPSSSSASPSKVTKDYGCKATIIRSLAQMSIEDALSLSPLPRVLLEARVPHHVVHANAAYHGLVQHQQPCRPANHGGESDSDDSRHVLLEEAIQDCFAGLNHNEKTMILVVSSVCCSEEVEPSNKTPLVTHYLVEARHWQEGSDDSDAPLFWTTTNSTPGTAGHAISTRAVG